MVLGEGHVLASYGVLGMSRCSPHLSFQVRGFEDAHRQPPPPHCYSMNEQLKTPLRRADIFTACKTGAYTHKHFSATNTGVLLEAMWCKEEKKGKKECRAMRKCGYCTVTKKENGLHCFTFCHRPKAGNQKRQTCLLHHFFFPQGELLSALNLWHLVSLKWVQRPRNKHLRVVAFTSKTSLCSMHKKVST